MSWIKENSFLAGVAAVTILGTAGLGYFISSQGARYTAAYDVFQEASSKQTKNSKMKLFPTAANAKKKKEAVEAYAAGVKKVEDVFSSYQPATLTDVPSDQFTGLLGTATKEVRAKMEEAGMEVPEKFNLGFEAYASSTAKQSATGELSVQLKALKWLMGQLADAGAKELIHLGREKIPAEKTGGDKKGGFVSPQTVELSFSGPESALRDLLTSISQSKDHLFGIRRVRIQNEKTNAPSQKDAKFPETQATAAADASATDDGGFFIGDDEESEPVEEEIVEEAGKRILAQVIGAENVNVYLELQLMAFAPKAGESVAK